MSARSPAPDTLAQRWRGQGSRVEVWYVTLTDPRTATGCWIHHEIVSPVTGGPYGHGWGAVFRPGTTPVLERFGPSLVRADGAGQAPLLGGDAVFDPPHLRAETGGLAWDLRWHDDVETRSEPLYTFPAWAWEREVLPAAHVVVVPSAPFEGTIRVGRDVVTMSPQTRGNVSHIFGHGNAQRWGWLHADLGNGDGDGDVLEVVSAVSRLPGLNKLPPLTFVQLRLGGRDWPRDPLVSAPLFRTNLGLPRWQVRGTVGRWRLRAEIEMADDRCVSVGYVDPDGATATCVNTEIADAEIILEHRRGVWEVERRWDLRANAHAEIGSRP